VSGTSAAEPLYDTEQLEPDAGSIVSGSKPRAARSTAFTTDAKSGNLPAFSLLYTGLPLIDTSNEVVRPLVPVTSALGNAARISFSSFS
jgi:hypothetical protein